MRQIESDLSFSWLEATTAIQAYLPYFEAWIHVTFSEMHLSRLSKSLPARDPQVAAATYAVMAAIKTCHLEKVKLDDQRQERLSDREKEEGTSPTLLDAELWVEDLADHFLMRYIEQEAIAIPKTTRRRARLGESRDIDITLSEDELDAFVTCRLGAQNDAMEEFKARMDAFEDGFDSDDSAYNSEGGEGGRLDWDRDDDPWDWRDQVNATEDEVQ
jgi:hypothetical protein